MGFYGLDDRMIDRRRKPAGERRTYETKQLWERSKEILGLHVLGMKGTEIAEKLNITPATVYSTTNSQLGQEYIKGIRESREGSIKTFKERIGELTERSLEFYQKVFDDPREGSLRLKKEISDTVLLELSGLRVPTKTQNQSMQVHANLEQIAEFKRRGLAAARANGTVVEYND